MFVTLASALGKIKIPDLGKLGGLEPLVKKLLEAVRGVNDNGQIGKATGFQITSLPALQRKFTDGLQAIGNQTFGGAPLGKILGAFSTDTKQFGEVTKDFARTVYAYFKGGSGGTGGGGGGGGGPKALPAPEGGFNFGSLLGKLGGLLNVATIAIQAGLKADEMFENWRRQALSANAANARFVPFSGELFSEQLRFNLGQFYRTREIAKATSATASELTRQTNTMESAFLPFDKMKADFANRIGIIKAVGVKAWADIVLTPIANAYDAIVRNVDPTGKGTAQAANYASRMAIYGGIGAALGAGIGSLFGGIGAIPGAAIGGVLGMAVGGVSAWLNPPKHDPQLQEEWRRFMTDAANKPFLRPPIRRPPAHF
jgi:hypothetical protein